MIIVVGIPGAGKSSILSEVQRLIPEVILVSYGDKMVEAAANEGLTRDALRKLPLHEQMQIGIRAAKKIEAIRTPYTILDTHALIKTPVGFCPGMPREIIEILSPRAFAWVQCSPHIIVERRKRDKTRQRDSETEEELALHQELTKSLPRAYPCLYNSLLYAHRRRYLPG